MQDVRGKRITLAGLGHFGGQIGAARWLVEQGANVLVTDRDPAEKLSDSMEKLKDLPLEYRLGEHRTTDFTDADLIVASPAIPPTNEYLSAARAASVPITTEIRLFIERCPATIIGVTGTKGKSTTTAVLSKMLQTRFTVWRGGNIGGSLLSDLEKIDKTHLVVLELSSYMLEYLGAMRWSPHVAVVTMLAADHLPWHGSLEAYRQAKTNIVRFQRPDDIAVLNETDQASMELAELTCARVMRFGIEGRESFALAIPGRHNQLNAQAAYTAAGALGVTWDAAQQSVGDFAGLNHRLQLVHEENGVRYYNDSIATIPQAAIAALDSFPPKKVIQIVGGSDHHLRLTEMCNALVERAKAVLCIGQTGNQLADLMSGNPHATAAAVYRCGDLPTAIKMAKQIASPGDVVLLSTGYKSFDQFVNYEKRGEAFGRLARGST
ncbi:MAG TPA: UDP-N-acetylmuramoyl-L-alanine--D-glutamate ligase [Tepidisphaeraceae bacterium]|jgi:UDP-N-acetylmuramoylalanine--D-glutamate ligase|nr:UDP-N-acetylmuramoyl-L-alanine--D-glutamate ligase [Tepidisphaeraceae bacterium]